MDHILKMVMKHLLAHIFIFISTRASNCHLILICSMECMMACISYYFLPTVYLFGSVYAFLQSIDDDLCKCIHEHWANLSPNWR